ncbi:MAG: NUDIX hydrolase [Micromonosporaceae bacterium]
MTTDPAATDGHTWTVSGSRQRIDDPWCMLRQDDVVLPSGARIDGYYVWDSPHIATVIPVTPDGRWVLCRQYRHAVGRVMLQFPAGMISDGERPEAAALRELEEETGYTARKLEHLADLAMYPTKLSGWHHIYLARDVVRTGSKADDPHEPIETVIVTEPELHKLIDTGELQVGDSMAGVLLAFRALAGDRARTKTEGHREASATSTPAADTQ